MRRARVIGHLLLTSVAFVEGRMPQSRGRTRDVTAPCLCNKDGPGVDATDLRGATKRKMGADATQKVCQPMMKDEPVRISL